ncbi:MAG: rhomboid family intramembrane serine protease [Candidatus Lokiarchaeota archaeon]|nr:rhomboid family intramembrane serine protease [Candidatus Lokiarchaeota archaeon]
MIILNIDDFKKAKITIGLLIFNIISFIVFNSPMGEEFSLLFVQNNRSVIYNYEIYRLLTAIFLHADVMHLFSNMLALMIFGTTIETNYNFSRLKFLLIYFLSGLLGNLFSLIFLPLDSYSLGASGAIFGLIGAAVILIIIDDPSLLIFVALYVGYFLLASFSPEVNIWAHIFGLLGGLLLGYIFNFNQIKQRKHNNYY